MKTMRELNAAVRAALDVSRTDLETWAVGDNAEEALANLAELTALVQRVEVARSTARRVALRDGATPEQVAQAMAGGPVK